MAKPNKWDKQHLRNLGLTQKQIDGIFDTAAKEAATIGASLHDFNPDKPFSFADYPATKARIEKLMRSLQNDMTTVIVNGVRSGWTLANNKNNALCDLVFGSNKSRLSKAQERKYYSNNDKALEAFIERKNAGLKLSDRVWNYTDQFKTEIEFGIDLDLRTGTSAAEMARNLKQYLKAPDKLFRRVRDEHGQLHLSKNAKAYHPGAGVYRSSYKNALRLARTETNMAYRTSDYTRWQQLDFVVGIEIGLSNNHPVADICDELKGKYPKDFKFTGWHPQCRCHALSILKTEEEMAADNERILNGGEPASDSVNTVKDVPEDFKKWVTKNSDRIAKAEKRGMLPYFLKDNVNFAGISINRINVTEITDLLKEAKLKYNAYSPEDWTKAYFDERSGGYNVYHKEHNFSTVGGKYEKEVGKLLAKEGKQVEFLSEKGQNTKHPDIRFDNQTWDVKSVIAYTSGSIMDSIWNGKKANNVIFYFTNGINMNIIEEGYKRVYGRFAKFDKLDRMPIVYYIDKNKRLIKYK
jgi:hypothetical protein